MVLGLVANRRWQRQKFYLCDFQRLLVVRKRRDTVDTKLYCWYKIQVSTLVKFSSEVNFGTSELSNVI